jgi:hypothetical protein
MKKLDECSNCGYVFTSEDEEPDYISEIGDNERDVSEKPVKKEAAVCPVCGEKCGARSKHRKKVVPDEE